MSTGERVPEIDRLKGLAIIFVLMIHAQPLVGTLLHDYVIDRAVPIFILLFGISSSYWWRKHSLSDGMIAAAGTWYRTRFARLLVPYWGMIAVWWAVTIVFARNVPTGPAHVAASIVGYLPHAGTSWFVTLILQLVVFFPLLFGAIRRLKTAVLLVAAAAATSVCYWRMFEIIEAVRYLLQDSAPAEGFYCFWYFWIFWPQYLWLLAVGAVLARTRVVLSYRAAACWAVCFLAGVYVHTAILEDPLSRAGLQRILDAPLAIVLLSGLSLLRYMPSAVAVLEWCGRWSWGLYLGQLLVHEITRTLGYRPEVGPSHHRWAYFALLLLGAITLSYGGAALRRAVSRRP
jgi:peptidoglycan/LPS O-acetylase OafA/YrhL